MEIYINRLVKGLSYTGISSFIIFHEFGTNFLGSNDRWRDSILMWAKNQSEFVSGITEFFLLIFFVASLVYFTKGIFYLRTIHIKKVPSLEISLKEMFSPPISGFNNDYEGNIEKIKSYRDSKLSTMMNSEAVEEYKKTAWIDSPIMGDYNHTKSVKKYINSNLAAKTYEQGYEWLKR